MHGGLCSCNSSILDVLTRHCRQILSLAAGQWDPKWAVGLCLSLLPMPLSPAAEHWRVHSASCQSSHPCTP